MPTSVSHTLTATFWPIPSSANLDLEGAGQPGVLQGDPFEGPLDFDFESIMMYPSDALTDTNACRSDIAKCPIVRRAGKDTSGNFKFEYIPAKQKPSAKDALFVKKYYPWH